MGKAPHKEIDTQKTEINFGPKSYAEILTTALQEGEEIFELTNKTVFLSALIAGLEIGFSYMFIAIIHQTLATKGLDASVIPIYYSIVYPIGFIMVILGKSMLFTEQTSILTLPVLNRERHWQELVRVWISVILGNILGGALFMAFISLLAPRMGLFSTQIMAQIGEHMLHYDSLTILLSAIVAGWLMGLLSWLLSTTPNSITRVFLIILITGIIGFGGFHHSIVGSIEALGGLLHSPNIHTLHYLRFVLLALLGNTIGGSIVVALFKFRIFKANFE